MFKRLTCISNSVLNATYCIMSNYNYQNVLLKRYFKNIKQELQKSGNIISSWLDYTVKPVKINKVFREGYFGEINIQENNNIETYQFVIIPKDKKKSLFINSKKAIQ